MKMGNAKTLVTFLTLAGLASSAAIIIFLFIPTAKEIIGLSDGIIRAHAELDAQYANRKDLLTSLTKSEEAAVGIRTLATQFVPAGRELDFITAVENIAAKNGVEERVQLSAIEGDKAAAELLENYNLTVSGRYRSVLQMLVDLEKMPTLLIVDSVVARPAPGATPRDQSFLSITMHGMIASPPNGL